MSASIQWPIAPVSPSPGFGRRRLRNLRWLAVVLALLGSVPAAGHPLAPALLELQEQSDGVVEARFKRTLYTRSRRAAELLAPILPEGCRAARPKRTTVEGTGLVERWGMECDSGLVGQTVGVGGLAENGIDALLRVTLVDGRDVQRVLRADRPTLVIPERPRRVQVVGSYLDMGARHIFGGLDHLLFVLGLAMLVAGGRGYLRRLLVTLSAFTLGHCLTLSLAALGWIRVPGPPIEFAIALSVLLLAVELARGVANDRRASRLPWVLAGSFGLLHGLGFAGALLEAGLPEGEILLALLSFNLGIEVGQVVFVAGILVLRAGLQRAGSERWLPAWAERVPVYAMGSLAAMWCIERGGDLFP